MTRFPPLGRKPTASVSASWNVCRLAPHRVRLAIALVMIMIGLTLPSASTAASATDVRPTALNPGTPPAGAADQGPLAGTQALQLSVVLPPSNSDTMQEILSQLYDPHSDLFHKWLAPGQFVQEFAPSTSEINTVTSWLHGVGLTDTSASDFSVDVTASAANVASALGTSFERYQTSSGHKGYLSMQVPLIPQSLAGGEISAILGLNTVTTFQSQIDSESSIASKTQGALQPDADGLTACAAAQAAAGPGYYTLDSLGAAYGIGSLLANGQSGQSETIGLYELASSSSFDVSQYKSCFGLTNPFSTVNVDGGGGTVGGTGTEEADADIEQAATQAPNATLISYEGPNSGSGPYDTWNQIVSSDTAQIVSTSWGLCEPLAESDDFVSSFSTLFVQAAAQGQTVLSASGDGGSEGCDSADKSTALEVTYPASDPSMTGVGGTNLLGPGDEVGWIDSGGGISRYQADPSWQPVDWHWTSPGNPCGLNCRQVPDISANAGVGMVIYQGGSWTVVGGTSLAAPMIAGLVADRNDGCSASTGDFAPLLNGANAQGLYGTALTDITSGNNDATDTYDGADYPASVGYDVVTGLGSPLAAGLSCPEVTSVVSANSSQAVVTGLGLEHASISFGGTVAQVVTATATSATVTVPVGVGVVAVRASSLLGTGTQSSAFTYGPTTPAFPTFGVYPEWLPANFQVSNVDHSEGSDTTLFAMQSVSDLYAQAGLFPFSCQLTTTDQDCLQPSGGVNPNNTQSDPVDNFAATEELQGVNNVGSGNGQAELCGTGVPVATTVDYARSSKPNSASCASAQLGYAKDGVPAVDFQNNIDPHLYGTPSGYDALVDPQCSTAGKFPSYSATNGAVTCTAFPSSGIGPVAAGWLPGDSFTCVPGTCSGTAFTDVDSTGGQTSVAYRLWCAHGPSSTPDESQITDWGQLTNFTTAQGVGNGTPIGVPIRIIGVNAASGTASTFNNFAKAGSGPNCTSSTSNFNLNAASGPDPDASQGPAPANLETALENDASQIGDFASANWGPTDPADQATDIATSLYYMGNGAYNTNPNAPEASLEVNSGLVPTTEPSTFTASEMALNQTPVSVANEISNAFPTARTLFNIYKTTAIRASTAGFLNWMCDTNPNPTTPILGGQVTKGTNHVDGGNFDKDLSNIIVGQYGFGRLTDATLELSATAQTTANGVVNPNASCDAQLSIASGGITAGSTTVTMTATVPSTVQPGWTVNIPSGYSVGTPTTARVPTDTIASISGNTITLTSPATTGTGSVAPSTLYFPGHPPILAITDPNS